MDSLVVEAPPDAFRVWRDEIEELFELSPADVEQRFREDEVYRRRFEARQVLVLIKLELSKRYKADGHATIFGFLRAAMHWSEAECRSRTKLARLFAAYPSIGEALFNGEISVANAEAIARLYANQRVRERFDEVIGELMSEASRREHDDFRLIVQRWEVLVDDGTRAERAEIHERRHARLAIDDRGKGTLQATWGDLDAARNAEILDRFEQAEWDADWAATVAAHGDQASAALMPRSHAQRRADALTAIFTRAASTPTDSRAPEPVGIVHVGWEHFADLMTTAGLFPERYNSDPFENPTAHLSELRCETGNGELINPDAVLRVLLEGYVRFVIHNDKGHVVRWGRRRRLFRGAARDAVISLSNRCTNPGCRVTATRCQANHLTPHGKGGRTDSDNGGPCCSRQNKFNSANDFTVTYEWDRQFHTYRPDGTEIR